MEAFANIISFISGFLYSYILIALLIAAGLYFIKRQALSSSACLGIDSRHRGKKRGQGIHFLFSGAYGLHRLPCRNRQRGRRNRCHHRRRRRCSVLDVAHRHHRQCLRLYRIPPSHRFIRKGEHGSYGGSAYYIKQGLALRFWAVRCPLPSSSPILPGQL